MCFGIQIDFSVCLFRALESNQYNHITATYFLLAERMLRERQEKEQHSQTRSPSPSKAQFRYTHTYVSGDRVLPLQCCVLSVLASLTADGQTFHFIFSERILTLTAARYLVSV